MWDPVTMAEKVIKARPTASGKRPGEEIRMEEERSTTGSANAQGTCHGGEGKGGGRASVGYPTIICAV